MDEDPDTDDENWGRDSELPLMDFEDITEVAWDDVKEVSLDLGKVKAARAVEMKFVRDRQIYKYATKDESWRVMLKAPIRLKWIDSDKGLLYRSRLVATEVRPKWQEAIFAATPPLEVMRALIAIAASGNTKGKPDDGLCLMLIDVSRAHFYARSKRRVFIDLPAEDPRAGEPGLCGEQERTMYGTYDVAALWADDYSGHLVDGGFVKGLASPCIFRHPKRDIRMMVHGDDFFAGAFKSQLKYRGQVLAPHYDIKVKMIGSHAGDEKSMKMLGRTVTYRKWGIEYEADPSHYQ